jgi:hypothetical protein
VVVPGVPAHLTIDFNLKASNEVDLSNGTVMVQPFLVADVDPQDVKIHRVRGPLQRVDIARSSFELRIRPFHRLVGDFGSLTVATDGNTAFEINGSVYQGAAGLAELALQPTFTATVAVGELSTTTRRFQAQEVYAGSSVAFGTADAITGNITARSGDTLTVRGATLARADGSVIFRDNVTVLVDGATKVVKQVSVETGLDKDSLSIGQRVRVFGTLSGAVGSQQLDARGSQGLARMLLTTLTGTVNATGAGEAQLALQTIDGRRVALFDFTGTGSSENADPAHYQVATGALSLSGLTNGTPVRVRGHVRPFGAAPADFTAQTLVNVVSLPAELGYGWDPAASAPFLSSSATQIVLSTTGVGGLHHVLRGGVATDLVTAPKAPSLVPTASLGLYAIGYQGTIEIHTTFDAYRQALDARLAASQKARFLGAYGHFDDATTTLAAGRALAAFE